MNVRRALVGPLEGEYWYVRLALGGIALLLGVLIVPLLYVGGQFAAVLRNGEHQALREDPRGLLGDGIRVLFIVIAYLLIPAVIGVWTIGASLVEFLSGTEQAFLLGLTWIVLGGGLTAVLTVLFGYLAVGGLVLFVRSGSILDAFAFRRLSVLLRSRPFAVGYATSLVLFFVIGVISAIPIVGWGIAPFATYFALLAAAGIWAEAARDAESDYDDSIF